MCFAAQGFASNASATPMARRQFSLIHRNETNSTIQSKKLSFTEWCMGIVVLPITMLLEVVQHLVAMLFHTVGVLMHAPRFVSGLCIMLGLTMYTYTFGGALALKAARRHRHWDE